jgi:hypothetical protein
LGDRDWGLGKLPVSLQQLDKKKPGITPGFFILNIRVEAGFMSAEQP